MKTKIILALFAVLANISVYAQIGNHQVPGYFGGSPKYFQEMLDFSSGQKNLTRVDIFVQIPYTSVQFIKKDSLFVAGYTITLSVYDKDKEKLMLEKTWSELIKLKDFDETNSKENSALAMRSFYLKPGDYFLRSSLQDNESQAQYSSETPFKVRSISGDVAVSDIMILAKRKEEAGKTKIVPYVSLNVANFKIGLPVFYEIYSKKPRKINICYSILDNDKKNIYSDTVSRSIDSGKTQIIYTLKDSSFSLGFYNLVINVKDSDNTTLASVDKRFFSRWIGVPSTIKDLNKAIEEMIYIASTSQINYIKDGKTQKEKLKRFMEFWKKQNPVSSDPVNKVFNEYYARVDYANEHFGDYFPGWRSDRGMVFILLGPPDNIDRHPFDMDSKPYEVWTYYQLDISLVFVDQTGFGNYRLITPLTGDLNKFRL